MSLDDAGKLTCSACYSHTYIHGYCNRIRSFSIDVMFIIIVQVDFSNSTAPSGRCITNTTKATQELASELVSLFDP